MKKTLLALMTAGTIGCSGYYGSGIQLSNPIDVNGEHILKDATYVDTDFNGNSIPCRRWVSATFNDNDGRLSSVRETTHCLYNRDVVMGIIGSVRYDSTDGDGLVDRRCITEGSSDLGVKNIYETCFDEGNREPLLSILLKLIE